MTATSAHPTPRGPSAADASGRALLRTVDRELGEPSFAANSAAFLERLVRFESGSLGPDLVEGFLREPDKLTAAWRGAR